MRQIKRWMVAAAACGLSLVAQAADWVVAQVGPFSGPLAGNGEANYVAPRPISIK